MRWSPADLMAERIGLGADLSPEEWRMIGRASTLYAGAWHEYRNNASATPPYGYDAEASEKANAELERLLRS